MIFRDAQSFFFPRRRGPPCPPEAHAVVAQYLAQADLRLGQAGDLFSTQRPVVAATLVRDAVSLLARAALVVHSRGAAAQAAMDAAVSLVEVHALAGRASEDQPAVHAALRARDPSYFDSLLDAPLTAVYEDLSREAVWLRTQVDLRTSAYIAGTRFGRLAAVAVMLLYGVYLAWASAYPQRNLALHKAVHLSTQQPGTPDPSGLVDGMKGSSYGACTEVGSSTPPFAIIDLGDVVPIRKIVVYNRGDSNFDDGLPYAIDLSQDGDTYENVAGRQKPFGLGGALSPPWTANVHKRARYVRIRANNYIALSEVEVF